MAQSFIYWILNSYFGLPPRASGVIDFFIYDYVKIILLLFAMITIVGFARTYLPQEKIKRWLSGRREGMGNILASLFGAVTPFCSCSSIPLFMGFLEARIPLGIAFSFLVTSPLVNEYLVVLMLGFFGWKVTAVYVAAGILLGVASGIIIGKMGLERHLVKGIISRHPVIKKKSYSGIKSRIHFGLNEAISITKKLWFWIMIGVGIGAVIHNFIPQETIQGIVSAGGAFTLPIAVLLGVPMYGSCAAIVPIAVALFQKGVPLGTALAFMMSISALSLPEAIILRRVMKLRLIAIFFGVVAAAIMLIGYLINAMQWVII